MKNSEIGHYWMARELSDISVADRADGSGCTVRVATQFPTDRFTLVLREHAVRRVQVNGADLRQAQSQRDFRSGTFWTTGKETFLAFDLQTGDTTLSVTF